MRAADREAAADSPASGILPVQPPIRSPTPASPSFVVPLILRSCPFGPRPAERLRSDVLAERLIRNTLSYTAAAGQMYHAAPRGEFRAPCPPVPNPIPSLDDVVN